MTERYIDPNSGAAPQPGGYALGGAATEDADPNEEHPAGNVTEPDEANEPELDDDGNPIPADVEEVSDEALRGAPYDATMETQAGPQGPQPGAEDADPIGPAGSYVGDPSLTTDDDGNPENDDDEDTSGEDDEAEQADVTATDADGQQTDVAEETTEETTTEEGTTEAPVEVEKPGGNASRADWVKFAKSEAGGNKTDAELEGKTRDEIRDLHA